MTTPIIEAMTPAQRHHSQLFKEFARGAGGPKLLDELSSAHVFMERIQTIDPVPLSEVVREFRCGADDAFIGTVQAARSLPVADGTFLFTEYTVLVTETIDGRGKIRPGTTVTVLRPGGTINVGEQVVTASVSYAPPLTIGESYLFFEKRIAATGAYHSAHLDGTPSVTSDTVMVKNGRPRRTSHGDLATGIPKEQFLSEVRAVGPCL